MICSFYILKKISAIDWRDDLVPHSWPSPCHSNTVTLNLRSFGVGKIFKYLLVAKTRSPLSNACNDFKDSLGNHLVRSPLIKKTMLENNRWGNAKVKYTLAAIAEHACVLCYNLDISEKEDSTRVTWCLIISIPQPQSNVLPLICAQKNVCH